MREIKHLLSNGTRKHDWRDLKITDCELVNRRISIVHDF